ncbi:MAG: YhcH/YjgK/YiaL family protein [Brevinema sp.]
MVVSNLERLILDEYTGNVLETFTFIENHYHEIINDDPTLSKSCARFSYILQKGTPTDDGVLWTSHFKHVYLLVILEGSQIVEFSDIKHLVPQHTDYEKDYAHYQPAEARGTVRLEKGDFVLFYPEDAHRSLSPSEEISTLLFKIALG